MSNVRWISRNLFRNQMIDAAIDDSAQTNYHIYSVKEFLKIQTRESKIYIDPFIRSESMILITGAAGSGKTMFTMGLCKSLVSGKPFGNWIVENKCKVLYVDGELPVYLMKERIQTLDLNEDDFYVLSSAIDDRTFDLSQPLFQQYIFDHLKARKIEVCVFDNLASLTNGIDENSKRDYDPINQFFLNLRRNGITPIIIHHTNKSKRNEQRGTSGRTDNIDIWCNIQSTNNNKLSVKLNFKKWRFEPTELISNSSFIFDNNEWLASNDNSEKITEQYITILGFIKEGMNQTQIGKKLNCSQPNINKIIVKMKEYDLLDGKNKITEEGMGYINEKRNIS